MDSYLSEEVMAGLDQARAQALHRTSRLRVCVGDKTYPVQRSWDGGFALAAENAPHLRGTIEFCDGARVLHECLIVCSALEGREIVYEYKRKTRADDRAPLDFELADDTPVALLTR
jgi:hypothetical protein